MLNLYQLQMFLAVVDKGSFSTAAEQLHVTQPAVSEGVRALEQRMGARLFDRRGHRAAVTPEGTALIAIARQLLALAEEAEQGLLRQRGVISGLLRLTTATAAGGPLLAAHLGAFTLVHPAVRSTLLAREPATVLEGLRSGEYDVGFLAERARGARLVHLLVAADEWVLLAPPGHPWLAEPPAPASRVALPDEPGAGASAPPRRKRGRPPGQRLGPATPRPLGLLPAPALRDQRLVLESADSILGGQARSELRDLLEERDLAWGELRPALELVSSVGVIRAVEAGAGIGIVALSQLHGYTGPATPFRLGGRPLLRHLFAVRDQRVGDSPVTTAWWEFLAARSTPSAES